MNISHPNYNSFLEFILFNSNFFVCLGKASEGNRQDQASSGAGGQRAAVGVAVHRLHGLDDAGDDPYHAGLQGDCLRHGLLGECGQRWHLLAGQRQVDTLPHRQ